jgi:hypothetical protein
MIRAVQNALGRGTRAAQRHQFAHERRDLPQQDSDLFGSLPPLTEDLEMLALDAFRVFGSQPDEWPDKVEINRNGTVDCNIVGTWRYDKDRQFYHVPFARLVSDDASSTGTSADSSQDDT